ncbi:MAG TPA: secondary thiamine-phosphate synthase enzyme YjbQ [Polyangiales bacterium]|nr:secondary thiamine-phosphate synthase enzyme YjbQ [Polyangiales bacterium]
MVHNGTIEIATRGRQLYDVTEQVQRVVREAHVDSGLCTVFVHHTSASLLITENADPDVHRDLEAFMSRLVPDGDRLFRHVAEGPDDMPSHVRSALTQTSLSMPIAGGRCDLGTWQGVYLWEHRLANHTRRLTVSVIGA